MLLWHVGMTTLIARYVFRDPGMDLRWLAVGALLPDIIDKPIASILWNDVFRTHRVFSHALLAPVLALALVMVSTRRSTAGRKAAIVVVLGWFVHLVLDGVWASPGGFLWPLFGFDFPPIAGSQFGTLLGDMLSNPLVWVGEAMGAAYLVYLWRARLSEPGDLRRFFRTGRIGMPSPGTLPSGSC